jgi:ribosomal protein S27AE
MGVDLASAGSLHVAEDAGEGEVKLMASVGDRSVTVVAEIVSRERYDSLLHQGEFDEAGESVEAAVTRIESGSIGARGAVLRDEGDQHKKLFIAIVGSAALLLGIAGLWAMRKSRRRERPSAASSSSRRPVPPSLAASEVAPAPKAEPAKGMVCPTCREEYAYNALFCANDGNRLVPLAQGFAVAPAGGVCPTCGQGYDPGIAVCPKHDEPLIPAAVYAAAAESKVLRVKKICPMCGAQFEGESQFCGKCGAALVPVN